MLERGRLNSSKLRLLLLSPIGDNFC